MSEYLHNIDAIHIETLPSGNKLSIKLPDIAAFLEASILDTDTHLLLTIAPHRKSVIKTTDVKGRDISSRQSKAINLIATLQIDGEQTIEILFAKLRELLSGPYLYEDNDTINEFAIIQDEDVIGIETPSGQTYLLYPDIATETVRIINSGSVPLGHSDSGGFVTTMPDSFDKVSPDAQTIDFCVAVSEFIELANKALANPQKRTTRKNTSFEFNLQGYAKNQQASQPAQNLAISLGDMAMNASRHFTTIPDRELLPDREITTFESTAGYEDQKEHLKVALAIHMNPHLADRYRLQPARGILLYGPAGTGKSTLAEACAADMGAKIIKITSDMIYAKYVGESSDNIAKIFNDAEKSDTPVVLFFDELDTLVNGSGNPGIDKAVLGILKQRLAEINNPNVLVIGTTNNKDGIDQALLRTGRFDTKIYIPIPNDSDRLAIFSLYISDGSGRIFDSIACEEDGQDSLVVNSSFRLFDNGISIAQLVAESDGLSGADIKAVMDYAKRKKLYEEVTRGTTSLITHNDLIGAIRALKQS